MKTEFNCTRETLLTQEMNDLLTDTFLRNPIFGDNIFGGDRGKMSLMMHLCLLYYSRYGIIYSLRDCNNRIVALSLWDEPGATPLDFGALLTHGFFFVTIKNTLGIGLKRMKKLLNIMNINEQHHIKEPHYYMFMLGSIKKGCGRILFNDCLERFKGHTLFWDSSVAKDNHAYYKSFGAEMIGEEIIDGYSNAYFVLKAAKIG
ncbi:MAG: hypothetical protein RSC80_07850 [Odoribacter sp.]